MPRIIQNPDPAFKNVVLPREYGRILAWMIAGAVRVIARGEKFDVPKRIERETSAFLVKQDVIASWIEDRCSEDKSKWTARTRLYASFKAWAERNKEWPMNSRDFYAELDDRGYPSRIVRGEPQFAGIEVRPWEESEIPLD